MATDRPRTRPWSATRAIMTVADVGPVAGGTAALFSTRSPAKDSENEDAAAIFAVDDRRAVLAVADGLGGHPAGAEAAELALKELGRCVGEVGAPGAGAGAGAGGGGRGGGRGDGGGDVLRAAILNGFEAANLAILELGVGAATTLSAIEVDGDRVRPYHAGDSMIMVVGQRGKVRLATVAHSPVGYAVEAGLLDEAQAIHHADRHLVSNIVGSPEMHIDVGGSLRLHARDTLLLSSDGLFDNLHLAEIVGAIRTGPLTEVASHLVQWSLSRMARAEPGRPCKPDDLTFILYRPQPG